MSVARWPNALRQPQRNDHLPSDSSSARIRPSPEDRSAPRSAGRAPREAIEHRTSSFEVQSSTSGLYPGGDGSLPWGWSDQPRSPMAEDRHSAKTSSIPNVPRTGEFRVDPRRPRTARAIPPPMDSGDVEATLSLIRRVSAADHAAFGPLNRRLLPVMQRYVRWRMARAVHKLQNLDEQDIVQEVWLALLRNGCHALREWDPRRGLTLEKYVLMITRRVVSHLERHCSVRQRIVATAELELADHVPASLLTSEASLCHGIAARQLSDYLSRVLPEKGRLVLASMYAGDLSPEEVAKALGVARQVVYNWHHRIRLLAQEFVAASGPMSGEGRAAMLLGRPACR